MTESPRITVDVFERQSAMDKPLSRRGMRVEVRRLAAGDYLFDDGAIVERKQVLDLHSSLQQGRFWRQLGNLRSASRKPYLLVEGGSIDNGPLSRPAIRGVCVAVLDMGVRLIQTQDRDDTADWLCRLAVRAVRSKRRTRPVYAQTPKPRLESVAEAMLTAVSGISTTTAQALLREFGSVASVLQASPDEWRRVTGIGARRAAALAAAFESTDPAMHSPPFGHSRVSREWQGRAT